jgi:hypothetical protein
MKSLIRLVTKTTLTSFYPSKTILLYINSSNIPFFYGQTNVFDPRPISTTSRPISTAPRPISIDGQPISTTPRPISTDVRPISTIPRPISTDGQPISTTSRPNSKSIQLNSPDNKAKTNEFINN